MSDGSYPQTTFRRSTSWPHLSHLGSVTVTFPSLHQGHSSVSRRSLHWSPIVMPQWGHVEFCSLKSQTCQHCGQRSCGTTLIPPPTTYRCDDESPQVRDGSWPGGADN